MSVHASADPIFRPSSLSFIKWKGFAFGWRSFSGIRQSDFRAAELDRPTDGRRMPTNANADDGSVDSEHDEWMQAAAAAGAAGGESEVEK